jgi:CheY-like chemotaxis protein
MKTLQRPLKFLIVDDSRAIQAIVSRAVQQCGYQPLEIELASDGRMGLEALQTFTPDLVITDWHMPHMSGLEMVQTMRQLGHLNLRVGFVTTERTESLLNEAIRNGAMFIVHKPFDDAELIAVVSAAINDLVGELLPQAQTPALPTPEPEPAAALPAMVSVPAISEVLNQVLGAIPYRLVTSDPMTPDNLTPNLLLGLYSASSKKGVHVIGLLDANAVCMIGGGALRTQPTMVRTAMAQEMPPQTFIDGAHKFLSTCAACLLPTVPAGGTVSLSKGSVVKRSFAKLQEVLVAKGERADFRISIPGYGQGRIAFFLME